MRISANPPVLPVWRDGDSLRRIAGAQTLAFARVEPVFTRRTEGNLALDLIFALEREIAVIPAIRIAHEMLLEPECSPFIWPACAEALDEATAASIERLVVPWLLSHAMTGQINDEMVRCFSAAMDARDFQRAREAHFAGAATYRETAKAAAPYVYAQRFAEGARAGIADPDGATGAVLLARSAASVACDLGNADLQDLASRWFGLPVFGKLEGTYDLGIGTEGRHAEIRFDERGEHIVHVATPVPSEFLISFDTGNAPACRTFSIDCKQRIPLRDAPPVACSAAVGGSSGSILLLASNVTVQLGALGDEIDELARCLKGEGFRADVRAAHSNPDTASYDLIHAFDLAGNPDFAPLLQHARGRGIPIVATAGTADAGVELAWGSPVVDALMRTIQDDAALRHHFEMLALRRLNTEHSNSASGEPDPRYLAAARAAFAAVDVLLVNGERELAALRQRFGYCGEAQNVVTYLPASSDTSMPEQSVDALCGTWEFAFAHAPIAPVSNLLLLSRAAQALNLPLIIAGPVTDALHYAYLHEALDGRTVLLPNATPQQVGALYRRARVFADVSWRQPSLYRFANAIVSGCSVVAAERSPAAAVWPEGVWTADPASVHAIEGGLAAAWERAPEPYVTQDTARQCDPAAAFLTTVRAYAQAQAARLPA